MSDRHLLVEIVDALETEGLGRNEYQLQQVIDVDALEQLMDSANDAHDDPDGDEKATVYLLTRTNYQLGVLSNALQQHGVPFDAIGDKMNPWPEKVVDCLIALRALRRGSPAPQEPVDTLLDVATNSDLRKERFEDADFDRKLRVDLESDVVYFPEQIEAAFPAGRPAPSWTSSISPITRRTCSGGAGVERRAVS